MSWFWKRSLILRDDKIGDKKYGGEREIRTPGIFRYAPFPRVCTRPLCDLSKVKELYWKCEKKQVENLYHTIHQFLYWIIYTMKNNNNIWYFSFDSRPTSPENQKPPLRWGFFGFSGASNGTRDSPPSPGSLRKNTKSSWYFSFDSRPIAILKIKIPRTSLGIVYFLERAMGLEPTTAAMARRYSSQLSYARTPDILWIFWKMQEKT